MDVHGPRTFKKIFGRPYRLNMSKTTYIIYFCLTSLFWGGSFIGIRYAIEDFSPFFAAFLRVFVCFVFLVFFLLIKKQSVRSALWLKSTLSGLFTMGIPWVFLFWGEKFVSPAVASIINSTVPIFVVLFTPFITPLDKLSWHKKLGVLVGFSGVVVIFGPSVGQDGLSLYVKGLLAIVMMAVCYAIGILWSRRLAQRVISMVHLFYQCVGAGLFLLAFSLIFEKNLMASQISGRAVFSILYLGLCSTVLAWLMFYQIIKNVGSVQASAATMCVPVIAVLLDWILLGKIILLHQATGAVLILCGLFLINRYRIRQTQKIELIENHST